MRSATLSPPSRDSSTPESPEVGSGRPSGTLRSVTGAAPVSEPQEQEGPRAIQVDILSERDDENSLCDFLPFPLRVL